MFRVVFPFELKLRNTVDGCAHADDLYSLFAVVVHVGSGPNHGARPGWPGVRACAAGRPCMLLPTQATLLGRSSVAGTWCHAKGTTYVLASHEMPPLGCGDHIQGMMCLASPALQHMEGGRCMGWASWLLRGRPQATT